jgi:hypothetical protein
MIVACVLFLLEAPIGTPSPTPTAPPSMGRSTPVPAGGSLQDLAKRRRGFSPAQGSQGTFSVASEGSYGPLRHDGLKARTVADGLLVEGKLVNDSPGAAWLALEIYATRQDGKIVRGIVSFPSAAGQTGAVEAGKSRPFSRVLSAPVDSADPASLRPETVGGRIHLLPGQGPQFSEVSPYSLAGQDYLKRIECLSYWGKPTRSPKAKEDDEVEVHVLNACSWPIRAKDTWFTIRIQMDVSVESWDQRVYGLFVEDVPPKGELQQVVPAIVPTNRHVRVVPWRLRE